MGTSAPQDETSTQQAFPMMPNTGTGSMQINPSSEFGGLSNLLSALHQRPQTPQSGSDLTSAGVAGTPFGFGSSNPYGQSFMNPAGMGGYMGPPLSGNVGATTTLAGPSPNQITPAPAQPSAPATQAQSPGGIFANNPLAQVLSVAGLRPQQG